MKNSPPLTALIGISILALTTTHGHAQKIFAEQRVIIIMMDGFAEKYYRAAAMPFLNQMEKDGIYKLVPSLMPAVTNVNNMAIATGTTPDQNGITGNVFYNEEKQQEEYVEDPSLLLKPSLFEQAHALGIKSALLSVKQKTIDVLGKYADFTLCPECVAAHENKWNGPVALADVYTREVNYQLMDAAILITADHGMNHKSRAWDLQQACTDQHTPVKIVISPEKDRYMKHHKGLGGSAYVYLQKPADSAAVRKMLTGLKGVDAVLTKAEAAKKYHLMPTRIGDFMVLGDSTTVFGQLNGNAYENLPDTYRSHGSTYEAETPLWVYNAKHAPPASYFNWNFQLAAWLFVD